MDFNDLPDELRAAMASRGILNAEDLEGWQMDPCLWDAMRGFSGSTGEELVRHGYGPDSTASNPPDCDHEWIHVGFTSGKMACRKCDIDRPPGFDKVENRAELDF